MAAFNKWSSALENKQDSSQKPYYSNKKKKERIEYTTENKTKCSFGWHTCLWLRVITFIVANWKLLIYIFNCVALWAILFSCIQFLLCLFYQKMPISWFVWLYIIFCFIFLFVSLPIGEILTRLFFLNQPIVFKKTLS